MTGRLGTSGEGAPRHPFLHLAGFGGWTERELQPLEGTYLPPAHLTDAMAAGALAAVVLLVAPLALLGSSLAGPVPQPEGGGQGLGQSVDEAGFTDVLPVDAIPAIVAPRFEDPSWLQGPDRVVGVDINGDARAYPIRILNWHEIVDDIVGGVPIAATWCPLCGTGIVYDRRAGTQTLTFHVSGKLYRNDLVMLDSETGSLWPQILGKAAVGPLLGRELNLIATTTTTWGAWRASHAGTLVLARPRCGEGIPTDCIAPPHQRDYTTNPYAGYESNPSTLFPRPYGDVSSSLHPKDVVLGVIVGRTPKAYPYAVLASNPAVNDVVEGVSIVVTFADGAAHAFESAGRRFTYDQGPSMKDQDGNAWDMTAGTGTAGSLKPVRAIPSFWFAWYDFYPSTEGYGFEPPGPPHGGGNPVNGGASLQTLGSLSAVVALAAVGAFLILKRRLGTTRRRRLGGR